MSHLLILPNLLIIYLDLALIYPCTKWLLLSVSPMPNSHKSVINFVVCCHWRVHLMRYLVKSLGGSKTSSTVCENIPQCRDVKRNFLLKSSNAAHGFYFVFSNDQSTKSYIVRRYLYLSRSMHFFYIHFFCYELCYWAKIKVKTLLDVYDTPLVPITISCYSHVHSPEILWMLHRVVSINTSHTDIVWWLTAETKMCFIMTQWISTRLLKRFLASVLHLNGLCPLPWSHTGRLRTLPDKSQLITHMKRMEEERDSRVSELSDAPTYSMKRHFFMVKHAAFLHVLLKCSVQW